MRRSLAISLTLCLLGLVLLSAIIGPLATGELGGQGGGLWLLPNAERATLENATRQRRLDIDTATMQADVDRQQRLADELAPWIAAANKARQAVQIALVTCAITVALGLGYALLRYAWRRANAIIIKPDKTGLFPLLSFAVKGIQIVHDANKSITATTLYAPSATAGQIAVIPVQAEAGPAQLHAALAGALVQAKAAEHRWPQVQRYTPPALSQAEDGPRDISTEISWPEHVDLARLVDDGAASLTRLVIGVAVDEYSQVTPVTASLYELMHVLLVGASGWGKSTWLRSFLYQVAISTEMCHVVAIDIAGSEFNALQSWSRMRYPVARDQNQAVALLAEVRREIERRKGLYQNLPLATRLDEYNRQTRQPLDPWIVAVDEGTALMNEPGIGEPMRAGVQTARQYGIYFLLAGQSANANVISSQTRDQFSSRLCFHTSPRSSLVVIDRRDAANLERPGLAYAQLPGRPLAQILAPEISREQFATALAGAGPQLAMPNVIEAAPNQANNAARIREMHAGGASMRKIENEIFGYVGGKAHEIVKATLETATTTTS